MPERFPRPADSQLEGPQHRVRPSVEQMYTRFPGVPHQSAEGKLYGPYNQLYYTPDLIEPWFAHGMAVTNRTTLTRREQEVCILATLSIIDTPYVRFAHRIIARDVGFTHDEIEAALQGTYDSSQAISADDVKISETEIAAYRLASILALSRGPIATSDFEEASKSLTRRKILDIVHLVMAYIYVCLLTNIGDGEVPLGDEGRE